MYKPKAIKHFQKAEKLQNQGKLPEAILEYKKAIKIEKKFFEAFNNLANSLRLNKRLKEASEAYKNAIAINPSLQVTILNLANTLSELSQFREALEYYNQAILLNPTQAKPYLERSLSYYHSNSFEDSLKDIDHYLNLMPNDPSAHLHKGNILKTLGRYSDALKSFETCISLNSRVPEFYINHGNTLRRLEENRAALDSFSKALEIKPDDVSALISRGSLLHEMDCYDDGLADLNNALKINNQSPIAHNFIGHIYSDLGSNNKAIEHFRLSLSINNDYAEAHHNLSISLLGNDHFEEGWSEFEYRDKTSNNPVNLIHIPNHNHWGGILNDYKELVIHGEQGLGDEILYGNFFHSLKWEIDPKNITITCDKRLIPIYERTHPEMSFLDRRDVENDFSSKAQVHLGSIGKYFLKDTADFKKLSHPCLIVDKAKSRSLRKSISSSGKKICGISWKSQKNSNNTSRYKSISLIDLLPILKKDDYIFVNLQYGDVSEELEKLSQDTGIKLINLEDIDNFNDIDSLLSLIDACDIVVTVSNVTAHLAGSIDKPTYLISPGKKGKFWYWKNRDESNRSRWYPSIQIIDQGDNLDWNKAIGEISTLI